MAPPFVPRAAKLAKVRYGSTVITSKAWEVTAEVESEADTTNFEGVQVGGLMCVEKLGCTVHATFTIELDADAASNLYDALTLGSGIGPLGNMPNRALTLYLNDIGSPAWVFPTPYFKSAPMTANVKESLRHRITGEGSTSFSYPTGPF